MTDSDILDRGGCRWLTTYEHAFQTGTKRAASAQLIACCACKTKVPYIESYVTRAYGRHGNVLPLPTFLHCKTCAETLDAQVAFMAAYRKDKNAALPDPVREKQEAELNAKARAMMERLPE